MKTLPDPDGSVIHTDVTITEIEGRRALAVLPIVPDKAPYRVREGIARRRVAVLEGVCPCGARARLRERPGAPAAVEVTHTDLCPASDERLIKAIRRWLR